jgi:hypothetical protein
MPSRGTRLLPALLVACVILQLVAAATARQPFIRSLKAAQSPAEVPDKSPPAKAYVAPAAPPSPKERAELERETKQDLQEAAVFSIAAYQAKEPNYTSPFPTITGAAGTEISSSVSVFYHSVRVLACPCAQIRSRALTSVPKPVVPPSLTCRPASTWLLTSLAIKCQLGRLLWQAP